MDFIKNLTGNDKKPQQSEPEQQQPAKQDGAGGFMDKLSSLAGGAKDEPKTESSTSGGFMDKINEMAGGGKKSEQNEDALDKGVDWVQENILKQGAQDNESAIEQAKDEQIADFIRKQYKTTTGSEFPIKDKEH